jgi:hypothetical protein
VKRRPRRIGDASDSTRSVVMEGTMLVGIVMLAAMIVAATSVCQCPLWEAHTAFVFLRGQLPGNRNK